MNRAPSFHDFDRVGRAPWQQWGVAWVLAWVSAWGAWQGRAAEPEYAIRRWSAEGDRLAARTIHALYFARDRHLWIGTDDGVARFDGRELRYHYGRQAPALAKGPVTGIVEDRDGTLWLGCNGGGVVAKRGMGFRGYGKDDGLGDERVLSLGLGASGILWIGTVEGLYQRRQDRFSEVPAWPPGKQKVLDIVEAADGALFVRSEAHGIWRRTQERWARIEGDAGKGPRTVHGMFSGPSGVVRLAASDGLWSVVGDRFSRQDVTPLDVGTPLFGGVEGEDGEIWLATSNAVLRGRGGEWQRVEVGAGTRVRTKASLVRDHQGNAWCLPDGPGLLQARRTGSAVSLPLPRVLVELVSADVRTNQWESRVRIRGEDGRWRGVEPEQLMDFAVQGPVRQFSSIVDSERRGENPRGGPGPRRGGGGRRPPRGGPRDPGGPPDDAPEGGWRPPRDEGPPEDRRPPPDDGSGREDRPRRDEGPLGEDRPRRDEGPSGGDRPPPRDDGAGPGRPKDPVSDVGAAGRPRNRGQTYNRPTSPPGKRRVGVVQPSAPLRFGPHTTFLEFEFSAPDYLAPESVSYEFQLEGRDETWAKFSAGLNSLYYTGLEPGQYTFRVRASGTGGSTFGEETRVEIELVPAWYQTKAARGSPALALVALGFGAYRIRMRVVLRQRDAQERLSRMLIESQEVERRRLASELHDSLSQTLLIMKNRAWMAGQAGPIPEKTKRQLSEISAAAEAAIAEVRALSHALRPPELDRLGLTRTFEALGERLAEAGGPAIECEIDPVDGLLPADREINLFRIAQEAANNAFKHAEARRLRIELCREDAVLRLVVRDDGRGMDTSRSGGSESSKRTGLGFESMAERARILGGQLTVESAPGQGVTVTAVIPYRASNARTHQGSDRR